LITIINKENIGQYVGHICQMHRLRKEAFNDRLGWSVIVNGNFEIDEYDALRAVYVLSETAGKVEGSVRLLPTIGPYMLRNTFPSFLNGNEAPTSANVWEASRFAVTYSSSKSKDGLSIATYELLIGVLHYCLIRDIDTILCVVDVRMERILRRAGWPMRRLCAPRRIGTTLSLAGQLDVSQWVLQQLRHRMEQLGVAHCDEDRIREPDFTDGQPPSGTVALLPARHHPQRDAPGMETCSPGESPAILTSTGRTLTQQDLHEEAQHEQSIRQSRRPICCSN
jgi:acyl homoserine lactone synthase